MLEVGKLYQCKDYFLMFYPDPETAECLASAVARRLAADAIDAEAAAAAAAFWSNRLGKFVFYVDKNTPILILNNKEEYIEVLVGEKKGWIIYRDWLNLKEIDYV